jgi:hypothetical protein
MRGEGLELLGDEERREREGLDEGKGWNDLEIYIVLTDNIPQVLPTMGDEFLISHRQQLVVQGCQVECWRLGHGSGMTVV